MQPTDHMSTAVEYSCGEKNKHSGNPQKHQADSLPGRYPLEFVPQEGEIVLGLCCLAEKSSHSLQLLQQIVVFANLRAKCFTDVAF